MTENTGSPRDSSSLPSENSAQTSSASLGKTRQFGSADVHAGASGSGEAEGSSPMAKQKTIIVNESAAQNPGSAASGGTKQFGTADEEASGDAEPEAKQFTAKKTMIISGGAAQDSGSAASGGTRQFGEKKGEAVPRSGTRQFGSDEIQPQKGGTKQFGADVKPPQKGGTKQFGSRGTSASGIRNVFGDYDPKNTGTGMSQIMEAEEVLEEDEEQIQASARLGPGSEVGHYELIRLLGKGGMGAVYLARDNRLGRRVAIKFLHTNDITQTRRFVLEARMTARCSHENIVIIYEADQFLDAPYMVLELLKGTSLQDMMDARPGPMPPARVAELLVPVLRALVCAHEMGIVHRDLKPDNIFVTRNGTVKVLDFGISKVLQEDDEHGEAEQPVPEESAAVSDTVRDLSEESASLTVAGAIMGTIPYMAPEQWRAKADIDAQADIWAMGIILFTMLSGRHPLQGLHGMQYAVVGNYKQPMPSLASAAPDLPPALVSLVDACLRKNRADRIKTAAELLEGLEHFLPGRQGLSADLSGSPYAGLSAFQESDADRFFGRDKEVAALVGMVRETPLTGVVGASGAGKSSIVRAGLVPALKRSGETWEAHFLRPGRTPILALVDAILPDEEAGKDSQNAENPRVERVADLAKKILAEPGRAGALLRERARKIGGNVLVFVDQFEELFTQGISKEERASFMACLASIADDASSPTRVVLSLRADFLNRVAEDRLFLDQLTQGLFFLAAPDRRGMREAIEEPARLLGYRFEDEAVVEEMLDHLAATPGALPLLQFAASKLWDSRDKGVKRLTTASYKAMGGIAGALATHADSILRDLPEDELKFARPLFLRLVSSEKTRALVPLKELEDISDAPETIKNLVNKLVQARLLVVQTTGGVPTVEIVHESLISSWPQLKRWLDESGEDVAFLEQLRNAARQWEAKGRSNDLLWRGDMVDEARRFAKRRNEKIPEAQQAFLDKTFSQAAKAARIKRVSIIGGAVFLTLVSAVTMFLKIDADKQRVEADRQKELALSAKSEADRQRDVAEQRLREIEEKEKARLAAQALADENARIAREQEARAQEEAKRAAEEEARRLEEMRKKESAEAEAKLEASRRAQAEELAALESERKRLAEERAKTEALQRAEAQRKAELEAKQRAAAEKKAAQEAEQRAEAQRQAELEAKRRASAEAKAAQESAKKRQAEIQAAVEARQREKAEMKAALESFRKRQAEETARKANEEKKAIDAANAARKARIGAIDDF